MPGDNPLEGFQFPEPVELDPLPPLSPQDVNYGGYEEAYGGEYGNMPRLTIEQVDTGIDAHDFKITASEDDVKVAAGIAHLGGLYRDSDNNVVYIVNPTQVLEKVDTAVPNGTWYYYVRWTHDPVVRSDADSTPIKSRTTIGQIELHHYNSANIVRKAEENAALAVLEANSGYQKLGKVVVSGGEVTEITQYVKGPIQPMQLHVLEGLTTTDDSAGANVVVDWNDPDGIGRLVANPVSEDSGNLITNGAEGGAFLDAAGILDSAGSPDVNQIYVSGGKLRVNITIGPEGTGPQEVEFDGDSTWTVHF